MALDIQKVHHIAIICSNYEQSKAFYTEVLGFEIIQETYRAERDSYKLDLSCRGNYIIELFSFPSPAPRPSYPEARGLRHLAFQVENLEKEKAKLEALLIPVEEIRIDPCTSKKFLFFQDPDGLPLELYQA